MTNRIQAKQTAPSFEAKDQAGQTVRSADLRGRWVVLYFYPKDETTGCTQEACGFRDEHASLRAEGAIVLGVSRDSADSHRRFAEHHRLPFQLLVDGDGKLQSAYGARGFLGFTRRITFLIDPSGQVVKTYKVRRWKGHAAEVLADLRASKTNIALSNPPKSEA